MAAELTRCLERPRQRFRLILSAHNAMGPSPRGQQLLPSSGATPVDHRQRRRRRAINLAERDEWLVALAVGRPGPALKWARCSAGGRKRVLCSAIRRKRLRGVSSAWQPLYHAGSCLCDVSRPCCRRVFVLPTGRWVPKRTIPALTPVSSFTV
jgi:hypothetical protein